MCETYRRLRCKCFAYFAKKAADSVNVVNNDFSQRGYKVSRLFRREEKLYGLKNIYHFFLMQNRYLEYIGDGAAKTRQDDMSLCECMCILYVRCQLLSAIMSVSIEVSILTKNNIFPRTHCNNFKRI